MINLETQEIEIIKAVFSCIISGFLISYTLRKCDQRWAQTFHISVTFLLLPVITYVITSVIQNNIALSLGMVGALSIVRFRHPVKNPLELVMYFDLITIGISAGVNLKFTLIITLITILVISLYFFYYYKLKKNNQNLSSSYFEGQNGVTIEIESKQNINDLIKNQRTIDVYADIESSEYTYRLFFQNIDEAKEFYENNLTNKFIHKIKYTNE
tara:strand:- start:2918 stop:3556 length:639 start_codon:yes stop_codon:yes gene_type:complete